jgi:hypothetical protein
MTLLALYSQVAPCVAMGEEKRSTRMPLVTHERRRALHCRGAMAVIIPWDSRILPGLPDTGNVLGCFRAPW